MSMTREEAVAWLSELLAGITHKTGDCREDCRKEYEDRLRIAVGLTAPEAPAATTCDCGKTPEACAATEDCSGQSMPAAAHERERAAVEFAANYRIWQNELSRTPSDETLRTAATYNKTLAFNKFIAADNAYLAASGRGKS